MAECHEDSFGCSRSETYSMAPMLVTQLVFFMLREGYNCSLTDLSQMTDKTTWAQTAAEVAGHE